MLKRRTVTVRFKEEERDRDMKRNVSLEEISDGKLYDANDLVKADCGGCAGCSACCHGMGNSIILDPMDVVRLAEGTGKTAEGLLAEGYLELNVVDGIILPNLKMTGTAEACAFLSPEGRCSIHPFRPGICRLFPLGRYYEKNTFRYFLQTHECPKSNRTKIRVRRWIDTPELQKYETYISDWHYFLEDVQGCLEQMEDETEVKNVNLYLLKLFYLKPYSGMSDFYQVFYDRLKQVREVLGA